MKKGLEMKFIERIITRKLFFSFVLMSPLIFVSTGINAVERKPFRPFRLALFLMAVVGSLSLLSIALARYAGVY